MLLACGVPGTVLVVNEKFIVSEHGIRHKGWNGRIKESIEWAAVRSFVLKPQASGAVYKLSTFLETITLDAYIGNWPSLKRFVIEHLPPDAEVDLEPKAQSLQTQSN